MQVVHTEPIELDDGYLLVNTEMLMEMLAEGKSVFLPELAELSVDVVGYSDEDWENYRQAMTVSEISSVVYVGEDEVQCIEIDDDQHLYLTDGYIASHNTSNIVFLKSTDDSMLDTLQKMSGTRHQVRTDSKMVTRDIEKIWMRNEGKMSYTASAKEEPVISYNDLAFLSERNSIVFRAGDSPIWNRNEMILPMSWRLFSNKIEHPGHEYSLQTIPTLSSAMDFDVRSNQPDFQKMLDKRIAQALQSEEAKTVFQRAYDYTDYEIERLDPDVYSDSIMDIINAKLHMEAGIKTIEDQEDYEPVSIRDSMEELSVDNVEQQEAIAEAAAQQEDFEKKRYAGGMLSKSNFVNPGGSVNRNLEQDIVAAFLETRSFFEGDQAVFKYTGTGLWSFDGKTPYIRIKDETQDLKMINAAKDEISSRVYSDDVEVCVEDIDSTGTFIVTDDFLRFLATWDKWTFAQGRFEEAMAHRMMIA